MGLPVPRWFNITPGVSLLCSVWLWEGGRECTPLSEDGKGVAEDTASVGTGGEGGKRLILGARSMATMGKSGDMATVSGSQGAAWGSSVSLGAETGDSKGALARSEVTGHAVGASVSSSLKPGIPLGIEVVGGISVGGHSQGSGGLLPPGGPATAPTH